MKDSTNLPEPDKDKIVLLPTKQLQLDTNNPRLAWRDGGNNPIDLAKVMWSEMAVDEVALSIAKNGFFHSEPLFVIIDESTKKGERKYIVIEGNRRLTAVQLLLNSELRKQIRATDLPIISREREEELQNLPCVIYPNKKELWATLGFKHINGSKPWDSFSKAKFISEVKEEYHNSLEEIAETIGDRHKTVARLYRGYAVLQQAEKEGIFSTEDRAKSHFSFSHLYTALDQPDFQKFLGIENKEISIKDPVPKNHIDNLQELMIWLFGKKSENIQPIIRSQNPDLNLLREIISKEDGIEALRNGYTLDDAHDVAIGDKKRFLSYLSSISIDLRKMKGTVSTGYDGSIEYLKSAKDCEKIISSIIKEMDEIAQEKNK
ncbi:ParB N-terminal domain-containing protein [Hymenobacter sp. B81]|uniref:ParB N-terminal domain-containing protein n=1 Tax=Hymenobacter sp. B81 TaxID=3344878 RepID=UPI0037DCBC10